MARRSDGSLAEAPPGRRLWGPPPKHRVEEDGGGLGFLREIPVLIVIAFAIALIVKTFVVQAFYIPSASMENTLLINDRVLVSKFTYDFHSPQPGNIVVFVAPDSAFSGNPPPQPGGLAGVFNSLKEAFGLPSTDRDFIKRVIGVAGDTIQIKNQTLFRNGKAVQEPYLHDHNPAGMGDYGPIVVPKGQLFVMGDNRADSEDSRVFGTITTHSVLGQAIIRIWPPTRIHIF